VLKTGGEHRPVAGLHFAGRVAGADIDAQGVERDGLAAFLFGGQVDGARSDHAGDALLAHQHRLAGQLAHVDASHDLELEQPITVIGRDHKADLVHVRSQHHLEAALALRAGLEGDDIAQRVHAGAVGQRAHLLQHQRAHRALIAGNAAGIG